MKKNLLNKRKFPLYICPCTELTTGVVFESIEELEEQESSKSKVKPTYVSLENAVMSIIDRRKIKMQQK